MTENDARFLRLDLCRSLFSLVTSLAVEAGTEHGHERDDVLGEFLFEGLCRLAFKHSNIGSRSSAHQPNQSGAEAQQSIFVNNGQRMSPALQNPIEKSPQSGFVAVETGTDIGDNLFTA